MVLRAFGVISVLIGAIVAGMGIYGLSQTAPNSVDFGIMVAPKIKPFDPKDWDKHSHAASVVFAGIGALVLAGGIALMRRKLYGLLLIAAGAIVAATYYWVIWLVGWARYAYESPDTFETSILAAIACTAVLTFVLLGRQRVDT